jgi:hypothetical protein
VTSRPTNELCPIKGSNRDIDRYSIDSIGNAMTRGGVPLGNCFVEHPLGILPGGTQMPEKQNPTRRHSDDLRTYPGEWARQGEIILRKPWMRVVFIAGLVGCVLLVLGIRIAAGP